MATQRFRPGDIIPSRWLNQVSSFIDDQKIAGKYARFAVRDTAMHSHAAIMPYSAFAEDGAYQDFPLALLTKWAIDSSNGGPMFTNGQYLTVADSGFPAFLIDGHPILLQCVDDPIQGNRYQPNSGGFLEQNDSGRLICHSNNRIEINETGIFYNPSWFSLYETGSGGGSNELVIFEITGSCYDSNDCACVEAEVVNQSCGLSSPQIGETIQVYDELGCRFNVPIGLLLGKRGVAARFNSDDGVYDSCKWVVIDLCCTRET